MLRKIENKLNDYIENQQLYNSWFYKNINFFDNINYNIFNATNIMLKCDILDFKITKISIDKQLELIKKFYSEYNLGKDVNIDKMIKNNTIKFIMNDDEKFNYYGSCYKKDGIKLIEIHCTGYLIDSVILLHELSHYQNMPDKSSIDNDLMTEAVAYAEELLYLDYLSKLGYSTECNEIKKTIFDQMNRLTSNSHVFFKSLMVYKKYNNLEKESFQDLNISNYDGIINSLNILLDENSLSNNFSFKCFYAFGYMLMLPIYYHDKNIEVITELHNIIKNNYFDSIITILREKYNISINIDDNINFINQYIKLNFNNEIKNSK